MDKKIEEKENMFILNNILQEVKPLKLREKIYWRIKEFIHKKIPENAVVLTKEELAQIQSNFFDAGIKHGSKETAEKFAEKLSIENTEQKAEIGRLTEEKKTLIWLNQDLKKQVDELKEENTELYKEHTTLIAGSILKKQDIAKDTAKEILQEYGYLLSKRAKDKIKSKYVVEVE